MSLILPKAFNLSGRVAVVTGGGGLLGREHALALAELGATVVVADLAEEAAYAVSEEVNAIDYPGCAISSWIDVTCQRSIEALACRLESDFGTADVLVNNASIDPKVGTQGLFEPSRLESLDRGSWQLQIDVGLTGALLCSKEFGTRMANNGRGVILNIASDLSVISPDQRLYRLAECDENSQPVKPVSYSVIKAGMLGLTRYLATYWPGGVVRANALSPGGVFNGQSSTFVEKLNDRIPMARMARTDEYRGAVQFLCSDASSYMTGQNLIIDGGRSVW
ncbi:SDR family oxidoreductase [Cyanobium sp. ATX 6F1]|uniref:SDR family oxidoreductase n=1 Tax=unclassified Cyanobium TaxID=2627006 RepID=UPI0020CDB0A7|nr:SDR family oxidoreductase [Cyanobium sp. ATX 6F1]MCP9915161.1 SDR family oxidoreductase [Cyanobium sp. ATX 6F1]